MSVKYPRLTILVIACIGLCPLLALAADTEAPSTELVARYPDLFAWMFGVGLLMLCALVGFMVHTGNNNNEKQWSKIDNHERRISNIEGICDERRREK